MLVCYRCGRPIGPCGIVACLQLHMHKVKDVLCLGCLRVAARAFVLAVRQLDYAAVALVRGLGVDPTSVPDPEPALPDEPESGSLPQ